MVVAWLICVALGIQNGFLVSWGTGRHNADLDASVILVPTFKHWYETTAPMDAINMGI
jgi:hypothetical protein